MASESLPSLRPATAPRKASITLLAPQKRASELAKTLERENEAKRVALRRQTIGVVYQFHHLLPEFSAEENVALPAILGGQRVAASTQLAHQLLDQVGLGHRFDHRPGELSGGERQRVAVARALAGQPKVLLMDEPTGNLDEATADQVLAMLVDLSETTQTSLVIVTHDRRVAAQTDQQFELHHGEMKAV